MITKISTVLPVRTILGRWVLAAVTVATVAGCGGGGSASDGRASIIVTTNILGDVVSSLVGDEAEVEVLLPPGQDPHELAPSPRQTAAMREADVLVENGAGFEVALADAIEAARADGVHVVTAIDGVDTIPLAGGGERVDPHFFGDPARMRAAAAFLGAELRTAIPALQTAAFDARVAAYLDELADLDRDTERALEAIPPSRRVLVTNHDVLGYFADRYGFDVIGVIIPGGSTLAEPSAADLDELSQRIDETGTPAIFADTSSPTRLADALANEGTNVAVVELHAESLGGPGSGAATYLEMVRDNVDRIVGALAP